MRLSLSIAALAALSPVFGFAIKRRCSISDAKLQVPANQTVLVAPTTAPSYILLGVGVQNYTCSSAGTYTTAGAVAELYDLSCYAHSPDFSDIQDEAYALWNNAPAVTDIKTISGAIAPLGVGSPLGEHYFITNANGGISPKWDFTATTGNTTAYLVGAKTGDLVAPTGANDVDWLSLKSVDGQLASQVFRVNTKGGVAPASCTVGSPLISVKYTSKYWLF